MRDPRDRALDRHTDLPPGCLPRHLDRPTGREDRWWEEEEPEGIDGAGDGADERGDDGPGDRALARSARRGG